MDLPSLAFILRSAALSPILDERKDSEQKFNQLQLQIAVDENCNMAVRQIASIQFKNFIAKHWSPEDGGQQRILPNDKELVRDNILACVTQVPTLLRADLDKRKSEKERLEVEGKNHEMEKLRKDKENSQGETVVLNTGLNYKYAT